MRRLTPVLLVIALAMTPVPLAADEGVPGRAELVAVVRDYRAALERVREFDEAAVERAARETEKRRELLARAIVSRRELEQSERVLAAAEAKFAETRGRIKEADYMLSEALAEPRPDTGFLPAPETPEPLPDQRPEPLPILVRYRGPDRWSLAEASKLQSFFARRFGRPLPVSAFGQTPLHDRLGFDHHEALDVAVPPDSPEGTALIQYLRDAGISFMAFRGFVRGEATGAHIHIGAASPILGHGGPRYGPPYSPNARSVPAKP